MSMFHQIPMINADESFKMIAKNAYYYYCCYLIDRSIDHITKDSNPTKKRSETIDTLIHHRGGGGRKCCLAWLMNKMTARQRADLQSIPFRTTPLVDVNGYGVRIGKLSRD